MSTPGSESLARTNASAWAGCRWMYWGAALLLVVAVLERVEARVALAEGGARVGLAGQVPPALEPVRLDRSRSRRDAHVDAAELAGDLEEAFDVRHGEVVDVHPGDRLDRLGLEQLAGLVGAGAQGAAGAQLSDVLGNVLVVGAEAGRVDLALGDDGAVDGDGMREVDDVVAGDGVAGRLLPAGEDAHEDQRVRVLRAQVPADATGARLGELRRTEGLPLEAGAALQAHEQDVHRAGRRNAASSEVRAALKRRGVADQAVGVTARHENNRCRKAQREVTDLTENQSADPGPAHTCSSRSGPSISTAKRRISQPNEM